MTVDSRVRPVATFSEWLTRFIDDPTPLGDLARDWTADGCRPPEPLFWPGLRDHLRYQHDACDLAIEAAATAWRLYLHEKTG